MASEITAWSLPHLLMGVGSVAVLLAAVAVQTSLLPAHKQWDTRRLNLGELNVVVLLTIAASIMLLIGVTEWDHLPAIEPGTLGASPFLQAFWARPLWLYPVVVLAIALFCGQISLQVLQRPGAAVLVMAGALFIRAVANFLLQEMSGELNTSAVSQFLALIPAAAMDLAYIYLMPSADRPYTALYASLTGIVAMMTGGLILLPRLLIYPPITEETVPSMVVMGVLVGLWSGWCGSSLGQWIGTVKRLPQPAGSRQVQVLAAGAGLLIAAMAFSVFFIVTAPPPM